MENASKALIISGSILIAILLIAYGVNTFNSAQPATQGVRQTMDATQIATFNNKFAGYTGTTVPRAKVKALANVIIANNAKSSNKVYFGTGTVTDPSAVQNAANLLSANTYKVEADVDDSTGILKGMKYTANP